MAKKQKDAGLPEWPGAKVWPLGKIKRYDKNPRRHPPEQIELLAKLFLKFGPDQPIVVDENGVILKGHGRLDGASHAKLLGFPVVQRFGMSESDKTALRISDNQVQLLSSWDNVLMLDELKSLKLEEYDIALLGFPERQLLAFGISSGTDSDQDPEAVPELPKKPVVRKGDLWLLGDHRMFCGDSTNADDVAKVMGGGKPNLLVSDPPYGVDYDPDWRNRADRANGKPYGARAIGQVTNDHRSDWTEAWKLYSGDVAYCWHAGLHASSTQRALESVGFEVRAQIIWAKTRLIISRGHYHVQHEPCWYAVRKGATGHWSGDRSQTTLWTIEHMKSDTGHGTQKPIECMKRPIENNSRKGESVYDPFVGSGTTIIACEMTGRKAIAIEIDPAYVQVCLERYANFVGSWAQIGLVSGDGKPTPFEEVQKMRSRKAARSISSSKTRAADSEMQSVPRAGG